MTCIKERFWWRNEKVDWWRIERLYLAVDFWNYLKKIVEKSIHCDEEEEHEDKLWLLQCTKSHRDQKNHTTVLKITSEINKKKLQLRPRNDFAQKIRHVIIGNWESIKQRDYHELNASNEFAVITMKNHTYNIFNRWCETKSSE